MLHSTSSSNALQQPTEESQKDDNRKTNLTLSTATVLNGTNNSSNVANPFSIDTNTLWNNLQEKIGVVPQDRIYHPELATGDVPRLYSNIEYDTVVLPASSTISIDNTSSSSITARVEKRVARHAAGSTLGAAALVAGTTVGAGILALPAATVSSGFIPSTVGLCFNWAYMTISGLLLAELSINRMAETGKPGLGILDLYITKSSLPPMKQLLPLLANVAYFFLHYAMMVAYISQGGQNLVAMFQGNIGGLEASHDFVVASQVLFASVSAITLYALSKFPVGIQNLNTVLVSGVVISFLGLIGIGAPTVNMSELLSPIHQHPENVISAFPIMVLSLVYQNVVPTVVTQLECDRQKITYAIVGGTLVPLLMFLLWNGVILGNMYNTDLPGSTTTIDPVAMLQAAAASSSSSNLGILSNLVQIFSELAIVTSLIGFVYGLIGAWTDVLKLPLSAGGPTATNNDNDTLWKPLLYGAVFIPPLAVVVASKGNPDIFIQALDYGGAFGVSTLFLLLPPFMVWNSRYSDTERRKLATLPLMPGGKLALGSLWKASATLIVEQGLDKLGVLRWFHDTFLT